MQLLTFPSAICYPIAIFLCGIGLLLIFGLPDYYRQKPGKVPSFYKSLFRRKIVLWNFVAVILQNFFLSAPYGRNWSCEFLSTLFPASRYTNTTLFQSYGTPSTPNPGKSSSSASSSSELSGASSFTSSAVSPSDTPGSSPSSHAVSAHHASSRSGGVFPVSDTTYHGLQEATLVEP